MNSKEIKIPGYMKLLAGQENVAKFNLRLPATNLEKNGKIKFDLQSFVPASKDDLTPKPDDYIKPEFRAISAAYLGETGYFLDFTKPGMLQASMPLMLPREKGGTRRQVLKFHRNHSRQIQDIVGWIENCKWSNGEEGLSAPGINIEVMIDWKLAPHEARKLMSDPPLVESVSISFMGKFEKSHPDLDDWEFYSVLGHEVDGQIVRIMVTQIDEYNHIGLVDEGADEEADMLEENEGQKANSKQYEVAMNSIQLSETILVALAKMLGVEKISAESELMAAIKVVLDSNATLKILNGELQEKADEMSDFLAARRAQVLALLDKLGEKAEGLRKVIAGSNDLQMLGALEQEYAAKLEEKFPLVCQKCGEKNLARRSSVEESPETKNDKSPVRPVSAASFKV